MGFGFEMGLLLFADVVSLNGSESASQRPREGGVDEGDKMQALDHRGVLQNACLPCLPSTSPSSIDNKPSFRKKLGPSRLSFKWRDGHAAPADPTLGKRCCIAHTFY